MYVSQWVTVMHFTRYLRSMGYCYAFYYVSQWVTVMHFTRYLNGLLLCILLCISMGYCYAFYLFYYAFYSMYLNGLLLCSETLSEKKLLQMLLRYLNGLLLCISFDCVAQWVTVMHVSLYLHLMHFTMSQWVTVMHLMFVARF